MLQFSRLSNVTKIIIIGDYKCPYCRIEVDKYAKQPRIWEHPVNGPPQTQNQIDAADMPHPGELDFANFQRGTYSLIMTLRYI